MSNWLWIWQSTAWTEPQSAAMQAWLGLQVAVVAIPVFVLLYWLKK